MPAMRLAPSPDVYDVPRYYGSEAHQYVMESLGRIGPSIVQLPIPFSGSTYFTRTGFKELSRALLGAVCASSLVRHPGLDPGSTFSSLPPEGRRGIPDQVRNDEALTLFDRALARFRQAAAILDSARSEPDEDAYDALLDSHSEALTALLALLALDLPALAAKLDAIVPQQAWELTGSEDCLEILRRDAHRLAASAA